MKPYLIASEITPVEVGERRLMLPLHSTLMHWFCLDDETPLAELTDAVADTFTRSIRLIPAEEKVFTASTMDGDMPVRVTTLRRTPELIDLHERLCSRLVSLDAQHEKPEYTHEGFHPHITHQAGETVDPCGYIARNLYIVTAERPEYDYVRTVLAKIALAK